MITAIFNAITALPKLLELVKSFVNWVADQIYQAEARRASENMKKATEIAKKTKDTSAMDRMFNPRK